MRRNSEQNSDLENEQPIEEEEHEVREHPIMQWINSTYNNLNIYSCVNILKRSIRLTGEIDSYIIDDTIAFLEKLEELDPKTPVTLIIDSVGGDVYAALKFYDYIRTLKIEVNTLVCGIAASGGSIISMGATGRRYMTENSTIMIHQLWGADVGKLSDKENSIEHQRKLQKNLNDIYFKHSKIKSQKRWKEILSKDSHFTADEALKNGFIDEKI